MHSVMSKCMMCFCDDCCALWLLGSFSIVLLLGLFVYWSCGSKESEEV